MRRGERGERGIKGEGKEGKEREERGEEQSGFKGPNIIMKGRDETHQVPA